MIHFVCSKCGEEVKSESLRQGDEFYHSECRGTTIIPELQGKKKTAESHGTSFKTEKRLHTQVSREALPPSEIGTLALELNQKISGYGMLFFGGILALIGAVVIVLALIFHEIAPGIAIFGIIAVIAGVIMQYFGRQEIRKAEFIAWCK